MALYVVHDGADNILTICENLQQLAEVFQLTGSASLEALQEKAELLGYVIEEAEED